MTAVPYYAWNNRLKGAMTVWLDEAAPVKARKKQSRVTPINKNDNPQTAVCGLCLWVSYSVREPLRQPDEHYFIFGFPLPTGKFSAA